MPTEGQRAVEIAEGQLGVAESPDGSNLGPPERYQRAYPGWGVGWAWCGAFAGWVLEETREGGAEFSDPSTATICSSKPATTAQPGAMAVDCGNHVTMIRYSLGGGSYACVGGNEGNAVRFSTRNLNGWTIRGPAWLDDGAEPDEPPERKWYFLQDVAAARQAGERMYYGGWSSKQSRDEILADLRDELGHELRAFRDPDFSGEYLIDNSAFCPGEFYGGWSSEASRDNARETLEERLGRELRPFSEMRTQAQGGVPWNTANAADPFA